MSRLVSDNPWTGLDAEDASSLCTRFKRSPSSKWFVGVLSPGRLEVLPRPLAAELANLVLEFGAFIEDSAGVRLDLIS